VELADSYLRSLRVEVSYWDHSECGSYLFRLSRNCFLGILIRPGALEHAAHEVQDCLCGFECYGREIEKPFLSSCDVWSWNRLPGRRVRIFSMPRIILQNSAPTRSNGVFVHDRAACFETRGDLHALLAKHSNRNKDKTKRKKDQKKKNRDRQSLAEICCETHIRPPWSGCRPAPER